MCVSAKPAAFSDTVVGTFEGNDGRRYLAYQNTALSLVPSSGVARRASKPVVAKPASGKRRAAGATTPPFNSIAPRVPGNWTFEDAETPKAPASGNALILPIPDELNNIKALNTETCPNFLKDIRKALAGPASFGIDGSRSVGKGRGIDAPVRIIQVGIYTVVLSASARAISKALRGAVAADKRPEIGQDLLDAYEEWYPGWALAVCCFNNTEAKRADPLLFSFEPSKQEDPDTFFIPMLDAHDGNRPDLTAEVDVDHTVFVSCADISGESVYYSDQSIASGVAAQLPQSVLGRDVKGSYRNGDLIYRRSDLLAGKFRGLRALPPGAPAGGAKLFI